MKKMMPVFMMCAVFASCLGKSYTDEKPPQKVVLHARTVLVKLCTDPIIVRAVKSENAKNKTLEKIRELDENWINTPGITDYMMALMNSECGKYLYELQKKNPYYGEIFVMDNQGAIVAMTDKTTDYWQGDEEKFKESFKNGIGAIHISNVEFDQSTQAYLVQVSLPVKDGNRVIGAVTVGIDVDKMEDMENR